MQSFLQPSSASTKHSPTRGPTRCWDSCWLQTFYISYSQTKYPSHRWTHFLFINQIIKSSTSLIFFVSFLGWGRKFCAKDGSRISFQKRPAHLPHQQLRHDAECLNGEMLRQIWKKEQTWEWFMCFCVTSQTSAYLQKLICKSKFDSNFLIFEFHNHLLLWLGLARRGQQTTAKRLKVSSSCSWPEHRSVVVGSIKKP